MHRFAQDLDLSFLVGKELNFITIDQNSLYLALGEPTPDSEDEAAEEEAESDNAIDIAIGGSWYLDSEAGDTVDESMEHNERESYQIHLLLGLKVLSFAVVNDTTLELRFESGFCLSVVDDSDEFETLNIDFGDTHIAV